MVGQSITFTATVTAGAGPVRRGPGPVQRRRDAARRGRRRHRRHRDPDHAHLAAGTHTITAAYLGTDMYAGSDDGLVQVVNSRPSTTLLTSDLSPSTVGAEVTFTATVTAGRWAGHRWIGAVQSTDRLRCARAADGAASLTANSLGVGTHTIAATYSGTTEIAGSIGQRGPGR